MPLEQRRRLVTSLPGPKSLELEAQRRGILPMALTNAMPAYIERAEGSILLDVDGNQIIDFNSGFGVMSVGHSHPSVLARVKRQLDDFSHTSFMGAPYGEYLELASALNKLTPGDHEKRTALFNSGSEAVENAVKIARHWTRRSAIVAFDGAYHGRTNLALALTAKQMPYKEGFGPFAPEIYRMPMADPYRWPTGADRCLEEAFDNFVMLVHVQVGERNVAAVIIEPIQGEGGVVVPPPGFLKRLSQWCALHGIVFICDEVQTGMCRTGDWYAAEHDGTVPDLVVSGKGLGGGLPISAVTGRAEIMDTVPPGGLGGTYSGNPVACAGALAVIDTMVELDLRSRARVIEQIIGERLQALQKKTDVVGDVRGRGAMIGVEMVYARGDTDPHPEMAGYVTRFCRSRGVLVAAGGTHRNVLRFLPALTISDELLHDGLDVVEEAFLTT